jgi:hypothetical protein
MDRLIAHRDLQLQRAFAVGKRRYIKDRSHKLDQAHRESARLDREYQEKMKSLI